MQKVDKYEDFMTDTMQLIRDLQLNMEQVVLGKTDVIRMCLVALLAGEHVLLEDVPGVGKTLVAKTLAKSVDGSFNRIQFTPDLLPSDIVGSSIYDDKTREFHFNKGPIFANVVLADEINRTPPRTQSALLEAMSDGQVSVDGRTHQLSPPFIVIATQNPFEFEGTFPLPESQLDRFLIRISMGYPERDDERAVLMSHREQEPVNSLRPIISCTQILNLQQVVRAVRVEESIYDFVLDIVAATRESDELRVGVSTRGALCLYRSAQALATVRDRDYVVPDDVKDLAIPVLSHRVIPKGHSHSSSRTAVESIIGRIVESIRVPV